MKLNRRRFLRGVSLATGAVLRVGLPPLAGFPGKFLVFASLVDAKLWTVLVIGESALMR
jgi:NADH:ubiquinone oxidoreductase subunit 2 (subunit N)